MTVTDWVRVVLQEYWPWIVIALILFRAAGWWIQIILIINMIRRIDRLEYVEMLSAEQRSNSQKRQLGIVIERLWSIDHKMDMVDQDLAEKVEAIRGVLWKIDQESTEANRHLSRLRGGTFEAPLPEDEG